jgi:isocitrate/isopropylmalate dehydrogenase
MKATITLLPGDGIGPEVTAEAKKVLQAVAGKYNHDFSFETGLMGGIAIDETGDPLPEETLGKCLAGQAVLLGAVGGPKWSDPTAAVRPEQGLLKLRKSLGAFANIRPVKVFPALAAASPLKPERVKDVDIVFVRELTGGIYFGSPQGREMTARRPFRPRHHALQRKRNRPRPPRRLPPRTAAARQADQRGQGERARLLPRLARSGARSGPRVPRCRIRGHSG